MTNLSLVSPDGVSENQVIRSNVAKTQQPDAERLNVNFDPYVFVFRSFYIGYSILSQKRTETLFPCAGGGSCHRILLIASV